MGDKGGNLQPLISFLAPKDEATLARYTETIAELASAQDQRVAAAGEGFAAWLQDLSTRELVDPCPAVSTDDLAVYCNLDETDDREVGCRITGRSAPVRSKSGTKNPTWADGKFHGALQFDGETWVDLGDAVRFDAMRALLDGPFADVTPEAFGADLTGLYGKGAADQAARHR